VAQNKASIAGRSPAVLRFHDLRIGPANPYSNGFDEQGAIARVGLGDILQSSTSSVFGFNCDRFHLVFSPLMPQR
jgi:hypothetical protein